MIHLEQIVGTERQISALYELFNNRQHRISAAVRIDKDAHHKFVTDHPYRAWFLIKSSNLVLGSLYISFDNAIGLDLEHAENISLNQLVSLVSEKYEPLPEIPSVRAGYFHINVPSGNHNLIRVLSDSGFRKIQETFIVKSDDK